MPTVFVCGTHATTVLILYVFLFIFHFIYLTSQVGNKVTLSLNFIHLCGNKAPMLKQDMLSSSHKSVQTNSANRLRQLFVTKVIVGHGKAVLKDPLEVPGKENSVVPTLQLQKPPEGLEGAASLSTQEAPSVKKHSWRFGNMLDIDINSTFPTIAPYCLLIVSEVFWGLIQMVGAQALGFWSCIQDQTVQVLALV